MRVEDLERELRAERPEPDLDFARRLDEWAEAGFPRDRGLGPRATERKGGLQRAWERLSATPARRMLLPAGAVATVVVVAGVAISRHDPEGTGLSRSASTATTEQASSAEDAASDGGAATPGAADSAVEAAPSLELDSGDPGIARGTDERIVDAERPALARRGGGRGPGGGQRGGRGHRPLRRRRRRLAGDLGRGRRPRLVRARDPLHAARRCARRPVRARRRDLAHGGRPRTSPPRRSARARISPTCTSASATPGSS